MKQQILFGAIGIVMIFTSCRSNHNSDVDDVEDRDTTSYNLNNSPDNRNDTTYQGSTSYNQNEVDIDSIPPAIRDAIDNDRDLHIDSIRSSRKMNSVESTYYEFYFGSDPTMVSFDENGNRRQP